MTARHSRISDMHTSPPKIIKDSLWLYARMGILLVLNLWTTRLLIEYMGVDGYGIWSLILSIVLVWSVLGDIIGDTIVRYVSVALARGRDRKRLDSIFRVFTRLYLGADLVMVVLASTVGYWWLTSYADISVSDKAAVTQTFFIVIAMLMIKALNVPFLSYLVAQEKFRKYVILSLAEGVGTFITALLLPLFPDSEALIGYGWMLVIAESAILVTYISSCRKDICTPASYKLDRQDRQLMRESIKYIAWIIIGASAVMVWIHGLNIAVNRIYGIEATAACAIAMGILVRLRGFCANAQRAVQPRLMKLYSAGRKPELTSLLRNYLAASILIISLICVPLYIFAPELLEMWLGIVPPTTVQLTRVVILSAWVIIFEIPLNAIIHASGNIKKFEIAEGSVLLLIIPVFCLTALSGGADLVTSFASQLAVIAIALAIRAVIAGRHIKRMTAHRQ